MYGGTLAPIVSNSVSVSGILRKSAHPAPGVFDPEDASDP
jgi:hypothetical protein